MKPAMWETALSVEEPFPHQERTEPSGRDRTENPKRNVRMGRSRPVLLLRAGEIWARVYSMTDDEALEILYLGEERKEEALGELFNRYHARLVTVLVKKVCLDHDCAQSGAAMALFELSRFAGTEVPKVHERPGRLWRWLLRRAASRTIDQYRQSRRLLSGVPDAEKEAVTQVSLEVVTETLVAPGDDPQTAAEATEDRIRIKQSILVFAEKLQEPDRSILLHDFWTKYWLGATVTEVTQYDEELIDRLDDVYSQDALRKKRARLAERLESFLRGKHS